MLAIIQLRNSAGSDLSSHKGAHPVNSGYLTPPPTALSFPSPPHDLSPPTAHLDTLESCKRALPGRYLTVIHCNYSGLMREAHSLPLKHTDGGE